MTEIELKNARYLHYMSLEGKKSILSWLEYKPAQIFAYEYLCLGPQKIKEITEEEILRNSFLSISGNTKETNNLLVYLNRIQRKSEKIDDEKPHLKSVNWEKCIHMPEGLEIESVSENDLKIYSLYCNLETNQPILYGNSTKNRFDNVGNIIILPDYTPKTEEYHYNSRSLKKIDKGSAEKAYQRLQLYYFRQLLETSREEALSRIKKLTQEDLRKICEK